MLSTTILNTSFCLCPCCMEQHAVQTVSYPDTLTFKGVEIAYDVVAEYCDKAEEYYATEAQMSENDLRMKNAYRKKMGLLTSEDIVRIRTKYDISQTDFCTVLGWGGKTITRYEGHQVQDAAHDAILCKISEDPAWFLELLEKSRGQLSEEAYCRYRLAAVSLCRNSADLYLRNLLGTQYLRFSEQPELTGNSPLQCEKIVDAIRFFAASPKVNGLSKGKLSKLLWYADALSYQRYGHGITGLVYCLLPMGAVPVAFDTVLCFPGIVSQEEECGEGSILRIISDGNPDYPALNSEDTGILDTVAERFGGLSKAEIVAKMREEPAIRATKAQEAIAYKPTLF